MRQACLIITLLAASVGAVGAFGAAPANASIAWCGPVEVASDGGMRGPWRQNESRYDYADRPLRHAFTLREPMLF
jgi:hypothetical protein